MTVPYTTTKPNSKVLGESEERIIITSGGEIPHTGDNTKEINIKITLVILLSSIFILFAYPKKK